ncbi:DUF11 domain-containing protein [Streptomyces sp. NPDC005181]|uniref:DUF11 domain-containing protein n=1 Tax=Streptomyces sp. NPDC005181 TaxID=3156869 RepID=UPI0033A6127F
MGTVPRGAPTVTNKGPVTATDVVVTLDGLKRLRVLDAVPAPEATTRAQLHWQAGSLAAGKSRTFTVRVKAGSSGKVTVTAEATSGTPDPDPNDNTATTRTLCRRNAHWPEWIRSTASRSAPAGCRQDCPGWSGGGQPGQSVCGTEGGRLSAEGSMGASAERSSPWAIGEARGHCPLRTHRWMNGQSVRIIPRTGSSLWVPISRSTGALPVPGRMGRAGTGCSRCGRPAHDVDVFLPSGTHGVPRSRFCPADHVITRLRRWNA